MKAKIFIFLTLIFCSFLLSSQTADSVSTEKDYFIKAHALAANDFKDSLLKQYLKLYPEGEFIKKAKSTIDICAWQNACYKNTLEAYQDYLNKFPEGKAIEIAQKKIVLLKEASKPNK